MSFGLFHFYSCFQAGNYVRDDTVPSLIHMVASSDNLQAYAVQQLFKAVQEDISQVYLALRLYTEIDTAFIK